jgi:2-hydroxychromene-2-carboxylate isomerase
VGTVVSLAEHRRTRGRAHRATFYFDLADPATYLAAERVERLPLPVAWAPARLPGAIPLPLAEAARRGRELGLPIALAEQPIPLPLAMRVAVHAVRHGRGAEFVLAATRLQFCGGYDLEDPAVFTEAVGAAGLDLDAALWAAGALELDESIDAAGAFLARRGVTTLPVVQTGQTLHAGESHIGAALQAMRGSRLVRTPAFR